MQLESRMAGNGPAVASLHGGVWVLRSLRDTIGSVRTLRRVLGLRDVANHGMAQYIVSTLLRCWRYL